jgi:hypothetical protein
MSQKGEDLIFVTQEEDLLSFPGIEPGVVQPVG